MFLFILSAIATYAIGGSTWELFKSACVCGALVAVFDTIRKHLPKRRKAKAKPRRKRTVRSVSSARSAKPEKTRKPSLIDRWRDECRRMAEAEAEAEVLVEVEADDDEGLEIEIETEAAASAVLPSAWDDEYWNSLPDRIMPIDEDDAASLKEAEEDPERKAIEKELKRLYRVLDGLYTRRDRMLYVYGAMGEDSTWKEAAQAKLERNKAWRGLDFDIRYTERHVEMLENDLEGLM